MYYNKYNNINNTSGGREDILLALATLVQETTDKSTREALRAAFETLNTDWA